MGRPSEGCQLCGNEDCDQTCMEDAYASTESSTESTLCAGESRDVSDTKSITPWNGAVFSNTMPCGEKHCKALKLRKIISQNHIYCQSAEAELERFKKCKCKGTGMNLKLGNCAKITNKGMTAECRTDDGWATVGPRVPCDGTASATVEINQLNLASHGKKVFVGLRVFHSDHPYGFRVWRYNSNGEVWQDTFMRSRNRRHSLIPGSQVTVSLERGLVTFKRNGEKVGGKIRLKRGTRNIQLIVGLGKVSKVTLLKL